MLKTASAGPVNRLLRMTLASATIAQHYGKRSNAAAYAPLANRRPTLFAGQSTVLKLKARLDAFISHVLPQFGNWQDAMHTEEPFLFHSLISFALNTKMLNPREVVAAAEQAWRSGDAPLPAVEGFIRQILGWREYVRGIYWSQMPGYRELNALEQHTPLPQWFWTARRKCAAWRTPLDSRSRSLRSPYPAPDDYREF